MDEKIKRKNNALTQAQAARLYSWLEEYRTLAAGETARILAEAASRGLGITITASNILSAKRSLGITKPRPIAPAGECRCRELAAAVLEWMTADPADGSEAAYQRYVKRLEALASGKPKEVVP